MKKRMKFALCLMAIIAAFSAPAANAATLCSVDETAWLNAKIEGTDKLVTLCGAVSADGVPTTLQIRVGKPGSMEKRAPAVERTSLKKFTYRRYTRPRTTYLKLEVTQNDLSFAILERFQADETLQSSTTLRITKASSGTEISSETLQPTTEPLQIMKLEKYVKNAPFDE